MGFVQNNREKHPQKLHGHPRARGYDVYGIGLKNELPKPQLKNSVLVHGRADFVYNKTVQMWAIYSCTLDAQE